MSRERKIIYIGILLMVGGSLASTSAALQADPAGRRHPLFFGERGKPAEAGGSSSGLTFVRVLSGNTPMFAPAGPSAAPEGIVIIAHDLTYVSEPDRVAGRGSPSPGTVRRNDTAAVKPGAAGPGQSTRGQPDAPRASAGVTAAVTAHNFVKTSKSGAGMSTVHESAALADTEELAAGKAVPAAAGRGISQGTAVSVSSFRRLPSGATARDLGYARGRIIVRFKSEGLHAVEECAATVIDEGVPFKNYLASRSDSLDRLVRVSRVRKARPLFVPREGLRTSEARILQGMRRARTEERFLERSSRARRRRGSRAPREEPPDLTNFYVIEIDGDIDPAEVSRLWKADSHVEAAYPDYLMKTSVFPATPPDDTYYADLQWALENTGQDMSGFPDGKAGAPGADMRAAEAWPESLGDGIIVAVNDSGVDYNHVDLAGQFWENPGETLNGIDDDGNGLIDDVMGWDFGDGDNDPMDFEGHGTHGAGIIAAVANNSEGISGVAPGARIMMVKGFSDDGTGFSSDLAAGMVYAAENGADVINNSWGCQDPCPSDPVMEDAVRTAHGLGAVVVFAAGNNDDDVENWSPNQMDEPIVVAGSDNTDERYTESNFGSTVDVTAPAVLIASTDVACGADDYCMRTGTSMAAPHVSGAAALILSWHAGENLTNAQVEALIKRTADDVGIVNQGTGRLNAAQALDLTNVRPVVSAGADREAGHGVLLSFNVSASSPDDQELALTAGVSGGAALATIGAAFIDNGNRTGTFSWTPSLDQVGLDPVIIFTATDPDGFTGTGEMAITVSRTEACADGFVDDGEQCDDGNITPGDGCNETCQVESCGDGVLDPGEECDDGNNTGGDGCSAGCRPEVCGNGVEDPGEECDDGGIVSGDGCSDICVEEFCGDGVLHAGLGEECDDGNNAGGDGCSAGCRPEVCGNGVEDPGEGCDDSGIVSGDGCSDICVEEFCGDGVLHAGLGEECDDGNNAGGDGCGAGCVIEFCGDGILQVGLGEQCDDGNNVDADGCSSGCEITSTCGNMVCEAGESCSTCRQDCGSCRGGSRMRRGF
jgi:cysteine-rich repeat protein